jgi:hypothetical protein
VNAAVDGEIRVELLGVDDTVLIPAAGCMPVKGDSTRHRVTFAPPADVGAHSERPVRFRFLLDRAKLFSFWLTTDADGRSRGYLSAGSPEANHENRDVRGG